MMTSPFTGGPAELKSEIITIKYRGEELQIKRYYYLCKDTGHKFTDAELDDKMVDAVHKAYKERTGIDPTKERRK